MKLLWTSSLCYECLLSGDRFKHLSFICWPIPLVYAWAVHFTKLSVAHRVEKSHHLNRFSNHSSAYIHCCRCNTPSQEGGLRCPTCDCSFQFTATLEQVTKTSLSAPRWRKCHDLFYFGWTPTSAAVQCYLCLEDYSAVSHCLTISHILVDVAAATGGLSAEHFLSWPVYATYHECKQKIVWTQQPARSLT